MVSVMEEISSNKIIYSVDSFQVIGPYHEDNPLPIGTAVGECENFHNHYHLSIYNPSAKRMELDPLAVTKYVEYEKIRHKRLAQRLYDAKTRESIRYNGIRWDADATAVKNITTWIQHASNVDDLPTGFAWRDANNNMHSFTDPKSLVEHLTGLLKMILDRETRLLQALWAEKDRIGLLNTVEEVEQYASPLDFDV